MDIRKLENPDRTFGPGPTAVLTGLRKLVPFQKPAEAPLTAPGDLATGLLKTATPRDFYSSDTIAMPGGAPRIPLAEPIKAAK
jgi:hypothetical protein